MRLHRAVTALAALVALTACEKNAVQDITSPPPAEARIRFFNFGLNTPQVHFFSGEQRLTASNVATCQGAANPPVTASDTVCLTTGVEGTTGVAYGSSAGNYRTIASGQHAVIARIATATDRGTPIATASTTVTDGKLYSYFVTGVYNTATKTADAFVVEDNLPATFDYTGTYVRIVNASANAQPITMVLTDIATGQTVTVGNAVAYKSASEFVKVPVGGYNLVLQVGNQLTVVGTNFGFEPGSVYSITLRGDMTVTSSTSANRPIIESWVYR